MIALDGCEWVFVLQQFSLMTLRGAINGMELARFRDASPFFMDIENSANRRKFEKRRVSADG
jgi:hypothetical protein